VLTAVTGMVDAASYLALGHVFTANMTGNIVLLAFASAGANGPSVLRSGAALAAFALGASVAGGIAARADAYRHKWTGISLGIEAGLLWASMAVVSAAGADLTHHFASLYGTIALSGLAMGIRYATVLKLQVHDVNPNVLTGTIGMLASGTHPRWTRGAASVAMMGAGAWLGTYLLRHSVAVVFGLAGSISAACALAAWFGLPGTSICEPERKVRTDNRVSRD
jgi:uncharacterized membrane protein YoaK (UPF0700 family)